MADDCDDINTLIADITERFAQQLTDLWILVDSSHQHLYLVTANKVECRYAVSTSKYGLGATQDSYKTPQGAHTIAQKIGQQCQLNEILRARQPTGECADIIDQPVAAQQDLVLTRILWLQGLEPGKNSGVGIDSMQRYIYIHGTAEEGLIGTPASHGCVRMKNSDVVEVYARVEEGTFVYIH